MVTDVNDKPPANTTVDQHGVWIKCTDRLPPYAKTVLTFSGSIYQGWRHHTDQDGEWWRILNRTDKEWNDITHWMPMPENPL